MTDKDQTSGDIDFSDGELAEMGVEVAGREGPPAPRRSRSMLRVPVDEVPRPQGAADSGPTRNTTTEPTLPAFGHADAADEVVEHAFGNGGTAEGVVPAALRLNATPARDELEAFSAQLFAERDRAMQLGLEVEETEEPDTDPKALASLRAKPPAKPPAPAAPVPPQPVGAAAGPAAQHPMSGTPAMGTPILTSGMVPQAVDDAPTRELTMPPMPLATPSAPARPAPTPTPVPAGQRPLSPALAALARAVSTAAAGGDGEWLQPMPGSPTPAKGIELRAAAMAKAVAKVEQRADRIDDEVELDGNELEDLTPPPELIEQPVRERARTLTPVAPPRPVEPSAPIEVADDPTAQTAHAPPPVPAAAHAPPPPPSASTSSPYVPVISSAPPPAPGTYVPPPQGAQLPPPVGAPTPSHTPPLGSPQQPGAAPPAPPPVHAAPPPAPIPHAATSGAHMPPPAPPPAHAPAAVPPPPPPAGAHPGAPPAPAQGAMSAAAAAAAAAVSPDTPLRPRRKRRAKQWFEEIFDDDYLRTLPYLTPRQTEREAQFIHESLAIPPGGTLLDLACGYGRHAMELAGKGYKVTGLDLSLPLLIRAADAARRVGVNVNFIHGDMREMTFEEEFNGAYCMFTSFGYFDDDTNRKVAANLARAIKPGGKLLIDVVNRDYLCRDLPTRVWWQGDGCVVLEEVDFNYFSSRLQVQRSIIFEDGRQVEQEISIRAYSLHEIGKVLHHSGFRVTEVSGGLSLRGKFFGANSRQLIVVAEKKLAP